MSGEGKGGRPPLRESMQQGGQLRCSEVVRVYETIVSWHEPVRINKTGVRLCGNTVLTGRLGGEEWEENIVGSNDRMSSTILIDVIGRRYHREVLVSRHYVI